MRVYHVIVTFTLFKAWFWNRDVAMLRNATLKAKHAVIFNKDVLPFAFERLQTFTLVRHRGSSLQPNYPKISPAVAGTSIASINHGMLIDAKTLSTSRRRLGRLLILRSGGWPLHNIVAAFFPTRQLLRQH